MLNSKFDLYKSGWLELVFENRNKTYGAYELRLHYASNLVRAMGIAFLAVGVLLAATILLMKAPSAVRPITPPDLTQRIIKVNVEKKTQIVPPKPVKPIAPAKPVATVRNPPMVVTVDTKADKPIKNDDLNKAQIGLKTTQGPVSAGTDLPVETPGNGQAAAPKVDNVIHDLGEGLDVMPAPVGGAEAWAKFLRKNLRFPAQAQDEGLSGKVFVSFVVEKDGSLSNIVVERGAGHGFDEEAARVLKLAKAWTPGKQNGQPVRVRYLIPINFQFSNGD